MSDNVLSTDTLTVGTRVRAIDHLSPAHYVTAGSLGTITHVHPWGDVEVRFDAPTRAVAPFGVYRRGLGQMLSPDELEVVAPPAQGVDG